MLNLKKKHLYEKKRSKITWQKLKKQLSQQEDLHT